MTQYPDLHPQPLISALSSDREIPGVPGPGGEPVARRPRAQHDLDVDPGQGRRPQGLGDVRVEDEVGRLQEDVSLRRHDHEGVELPDRRPLRVGPRGEDLDRHVFVSGGGPPTFEGPPPAAPRRASPRPPPSGPPAGPAAPSGKYGAENRFPRRALSQPPANPACKTAAASPTTRSWVSRQESNPSPPSRCSFPMFMPPV